MTRQIGEQLDERGGVVRRQTTRGLVEEHDHGIRDQLHGNVDAFALPAAQDLLLGLADLQIFDVLEP